MSSNFRWTIIFLSFLLGIGMGAWIAPSSVLSIIRTDLKLNHTEASLIFSVVGIALSLGSFMGGLMVDKLGVRNTIGIGASLISVGSVSRGYAASYLLMLALTVVMGIGMAMILPSFPKLIGQWFQSSERGFATSIYISGLYAGNAIVLAFSVPLTELLDGWRNTLVFWGLPMVFSTGLWWALGRENKQEPKRNSDESNSSALQSRSWLTSDIWLLSLILFASYTFSGVYSAFLPTMLFEKGMDLATSGFMSSLLVIISPPASIAISAASDRVGSRKPFLLVSTLSLALASYLLMVSPPSAIAWIIILLGSGTVGGVTLCRVSSIELSDASTLGKVSGFLLAVGYAGSFVGPILAGYIRDTIGGFDPVSMIMILVALIVSIFALRLTDTGRRRKSVVRQA